MFSNERTQLTAYIIYQTTPWNPTNDSGVLNCSKLYENGGLVAGPAAVPDSFNGSFAEIDEQLAEGRRYDNTQTSLQD